MSIAARFLAEHYPLVTTGTGCGKGVAETIEQSVQAVGARIKAVNPDTKVGMYRTLGLLSLPVFQAASTI